MATLHTERLTLRPWTLDDFEDFAAMSADPAVMQFLAIDGKPLSRFGAWQSFSGIVGHWTLRGYGLFAILERATGRFVGRAGLRSEFWGGNKKGCASRVLHPYTPRRKRGMECVKCFSPSSSWAR